MKEGNLAQATPILLRSWRTDAGRSGRTDGVLLIAARARRGDLEGALALLEEAEARTLPPPHLADLASAIATNLPNPAAAFERLSADARFLASAHRAALLARLKERTGDIRGAAFYWEVAARQAPEEVTWPRQLARIYAVTGQMDRLQEALEQVVRLSPLDEAARTDLVRRLAASGRAEDARAAAWPPEGLLPEPDRSLLAGRILLRAGRAEEAAAVYRTILEAEPGRCEAEVGLARALLDAGETQAGAERLWRLVTDAKAHPSCRPAEVTRLLLTRVPGARKRLRRLLRRGAIPEAETVAAVLKERLPDPR